MLDIESGVSGDQTPLLGQRGKLSKRDDHDSLYVWAEKWGLFATDPTWHGGAPSAASPHNFRGSFREVSFGAGDARPQSRTPCAIFLKVNNRPLE
jgi:hypothetical protein